MVLGYRYYLDKAHTIELCYRVPEVCTVIDAIKVGVEKYGLSRFDRYTCERTGKAVYRLDKYELSEPEIRGWHLMKKNKAYFPSDDEAELVYLDKGLKNE